MIRMTFALTAAWLAAGCADPIDHARPDAGAPEDAATAGKVTTTRNVADGTYTTVVDASSMTDWIHADLELGAEAPVTSPWDLRFQRFHISTNGGVTGSGGVEVAAITGTAFAAVTTAPTTGYLADAADGDADGTPDYAFERGDGWYDYDPATHLLSPRPIVWVVRTAGGATLKLEIVRYYDAAGTSGWFTLHWGPL